MIMSTDLKISNQIKELPKGWKIRSLEELCDVIMGQSPPSDSYRKEFGGLPFFQGKTDFGEFNPLASTWCTCPIKIAEPGDILICVRAPVGPTNMATEKCCIGRGLAAIRPKAGTSISFILFALRLFENDLVRRGSGSTFSAISRADLCSLKIPTPDSIEQKRIATNLEQCLSYVRAARIAAEAQLEAAKALPTAYLRSSLTGGKLKKYHLSDCLLEVKNGVGTEWAKYPVLGATRAGLAPAKDPVGKTPERYKLADHGTVFYNPMRILLGSIAMVDHCDEPGITSPDYVVVKGKPKILDTRWFYYFFRSTMGEHLIKTLVRGAVRERILFKRLAKGEIELPPWETQVKLSNQMYKARDLIKPIEDRIKEIEALPAKYLKMAFNGEF